MYAYFRSRTAGRNAMPSCVFARRDARTNRREGTRKMRAFFPARRAIFARRVRALFKFPGRVRRTEMEANANGKAHGDQEAAGEPVSGPGRQSAPHLR